MTARLAVLLLLPIALLTLDGCRSRAKKPVEAPPKDYNRELAPGQHALTEVDPRSLPPLRLTAASRGEVRQGIAYSLAWLAKPSADARYPVAGITRDQVVRSLQAIDQLLATTPSDSVLDEAIRTRFRAFRSVGCDQQGTVLFTGYCTPYYPASRTRDARFRFPLMRRPKDLESGTGDALSQQRLPDGGRRPYPARAEIESSGMLTGNELIWLDDAFACYVVQVQGSAKLRLADGSLVEVGFDGTNNHPYRSIGKEMIAAGVIRAEDLSLATLRTWFRDHPAELTTWTAKNPRYVFFAETRGGPYGSLGQKVTTHVSVATDKAIFPAGAPLIVATRLAGTTGASNHAALRLDQDAGGGIRAAGRCDLYMGEGEPAEQAAGRQYAEGQMYYLILKD